ncbi:hypothetical protein [Streptomyces albicerus]|uniref:hypothetical protein n=1 Tax=Streptomyces albicerus TaxID=2569859 RepID=UPI00124B8D69|nr:hypothetical protein [Streptomyces albicerus]
MAYATSAEYQTYTGQTPPADIDRLLARASELLDSDVLLGAVYDVDASGLPTDADVIKAFSDATCAQVEYWEEEGEESDVSGRTAEEVALGSARIKYGARSSASSGAGGGQPVVAPRVWRSLTAPKLAGYPSGTRKLTLGVVVT